MARRDPYEVLGVSRGAAADEIKSAYRRLARRYHPDVNPDDPSAEEKFKEIGEAYATLSDPQKKERFDRFGHADEQGPGDFFGGAGGAGGFGDLFDMFFGGGGATAGGARRGRDGDDLRFDLELTLMDVLKGVEREIEVDRLAECDKCQGNGTKDGNPPPPCPTCKGQGVVASVRSTFIGQVRTTSPCPTCRGEGAVITDKCEKCQGRRVVPKTEGVKLNVPPGFDSGATMHLPGQGNDGWGLGRPGDLYVVLSVKDDPRFDRQGQTLYTSLALTFAQAALGDHLEIDGLDASVEIEIASGTQPGTRIGVKNAGLPPLHGGRRGDLIVNVTVKVPEKVSEAEAKLIRELAELRGEAIPKGTEKGGLLGGLFGKKR
jgi:molecular chaperone DnaJ